MSPGSATLTKNPSLDFLLIGGASIIVYLLLAITGVTSSGFDIVWTMALLAFFVNWPHFLISYEILYAGHRHQLLRSFRFFWASIIVPLGLIGLMVFGAIVPSAQIFPALLYLMFFLVGWHYIKQAYGCFAVYCSGQKVKLTQKELIIIRASLYPLWIASFLKMFQVGGVKSYYGLDYYVPVLSSGWINLSYLLAVLGVIPVISVFTLRYFQGKEQPGLIAVTPLIAVFIWLFPLFKNEVFFYVIPFFHSLQYMLFSGVFTKNKAISTKRNFWSEILKWWGGAFIFGALAFEILPSELDKLQLSVAHISPSFFLMSFIIFINLHHYFIDNVLWRRDNPSVREHLLFNVGGRQKSQQEASGIARV